MAKASEVTRPTYSCRAIIIPNTSYVATMLLEKKDYMIKVPGHDKDIFW